MKTTIKIKGKNVPLHFGYASQRRLGAFLGEDTYDGTAKKVADALMGLADQERSGGSLPFEVLDTLGFMVLSAAGEDPGFTKDDAVDSMFEDMDGMKVFVEAWAESMPKAKNDAGVQKKTTARKSRAR